ncbi:MAG: S1 RNA-binding domain-containing protein [Chloroflexota bacterium]|jgi:small subunit ribosomal protein S1
MSDESMKSLEDLLDQHDYEMPQAGDIRTGVIVANTVQGLIIDLGLKRDGIVPQSDLAKLEPGEREALKVNDEVPVYVVQTEDPEALVVSIHLARLNQDWFEAEQKMESGEIFEGEVIGYNKGGIIVPYGRVRGFVPISHLSDVTPGMGERRRQQRLARLRGETVAVKIIEVDRQRHRLVMSQREAQKEWEEKKRGELMETLSAGDILTGRISGMRDFGAFVDLGGADGLVHISELSWHRIEHPREEVRLGDEVEVQVLSIDQESGRISLSRKKLLPNPWHTVAQRYSQNELVEGKITRILDYGAFAEIEPGVEGLLHVSQLSRNTVENPREVVQEGEVHLLRIVSIDQKRQRIGLSLKAVTPTEQIEWMAQKELADDMQREEEEVAEAARASRQKPAEPSADVEEPSEPVAETDEQVEEVSDEPQDSAAIEASDTIEESTSEEPVTTEESVVTNEAVEVSEVDQTIGEVADETVEPSDEEPVAAQEPFVKTDEETGVSEEDDAFEVVETTTEETAAEVDLVVEEVPAETGAASDPVEEAIESVIEEESEVVVPADEEASSQIDDGEDASSEVGSSEEVEERVEESESTAEQAEVEDEEPVNQE